MSNTNTRFVWFEYLSDEAAAARRFYGEVLPWTVEEMEMGGDAPYPMIKVGDAGIGGFAPLPRPGVEPHWVGYLAVDDVDAAAKKVVAGGGKALMDAFDVPTVGRMQPVADPEGGALFLFKGAGDDAPAAEGPGSFHWNELWADDPEALAAFYQKALGLGGESMQMPEGPYCMLTAGGAPIAGILGKPAAGVPTHWMPYVAVDDADAAVKRAVSGGGEQIGDMHDVQGVGRFGIVKDPQGATLGLIKPAAK